MRLRRRAALGVALVAGAIGCSDAPRGPAAAGPCASVSERQPAPELRLRSLDGREYALAELKGRTIVLDFWATWCPPCEFQIPVLNAISDAWRERGVMVLGVAVDADGAEAVGPYAAEREIRYPILLGDETLARSFGAVGFPTSVLVAPDGTMTRPHAGLLEQEDLDRQLACLQPPATEEDDSPPPS